MARKKTKKKKISKKTSKKKAKKVAKQKGKKTLKKKTKKIAKKKTSKKVARKKVTKKKLKKKITKKKKAKKKTVKKLKKKTKKIAKKKAKKVTKKTSKKKKKTVKKKKVTKKLKKKLKKVLTKKEILKIKDDVDQAFKEELVELKDAFGNKLCCSKDCDQPATVRDKHRQHYCRPHYIALWESIQIRNGILTGDVLKIFIDHIVNKYPEKFLEIMRKDLSTEKDFVTALQDLDISELSPFDDHFGYDSEESSEDF